MTFPQRAAKKAFQALIGGVVLSVGYLVSSCFAFPFLFEPFEGKVKTTNMDILTHPGGKFSTITLKCELENGRVVSLPRAFLNKIHPGDIIRSIGAFHAIDINGVWDFTFLSQTVEGAFSIAVCGFIGVFLFGVFFL